ncbi:Ligatin [Arthrobotrys entomopaga]|nr:Ligatin [Arthrobotrys entomopaga]
MFKKKPTFTDTLRIIKVKPAAPLRSSDRRKLAASIITDFSLSPLLSTKDTPPSQQPPTDTNTNTNTTTAEDAETTSSAAATTTTTTTTTSTQPDPSLTALRNTLLPESTVSAKFTTTLGPDLHPVNGIIYSGTHPNSSIITDGKTRPLWVKTDECWFPSVYTCWEGVEYGVLPIVYTHAGVMEKVYGGADLMVPGVVGVRRKNHKDGGDGGGVKKGEVVAVADYKCENVVLAVGIAEVDMGVDGGIGGKGKGVRILHWVGDELWSMGGGGGINPPESLEVHWGTQEEEQEEEEEGGVSLKGLKIDDGNNDSNKGDEGEGEVVLDKGKGIAKESDGEDDEDDEPQFPELTTPGTVLYHLFGGVLRLAN